MDRPVQSAEPVYRLAVDLLRHFSVTMPVRLIGVGASGLMPESTPIQADLFTDDDRQGSPKWDKVDRAMDAVNRRYGEKAVARGTLPRTK